MVPSSTAEWCIKNLPVMPRIKQRRLEAPYTKANKLRIGDQVIRLTRLSFLDDIRMNPREFKTSVESIGVTWMHEYYDPMTNSLMSYHHGICCGNNQIIDMQGEGLMKSSGSKSGNCLRVVDYQTFGEGNTIYVVQHEPHEYVFPRRMIADRARACMNLSKLQFDNLYNNCDLWATYCSTGHMQSMAMNGLIERIFGSICHVVLCGVVLGARICLMMFVMLLVIVIVSFAVHIISRFTRRSRVPKLVLPSDKNTESIASMATNIIKE